MRCGRPSWRARARLGAAATRRRGPNHSDRTCFNPGRLLFCKRAPKAIAGFAETMRAYRSESTICEAVPLCAINWVELARGCIHWPHVLLLMTSRALARRLGWPCWRSLCRRLRRGVEGGDGTLLYAYTRPSIAPSVPEPATWSLLVAGTAVAFVRRHRANLMMT
jgi:hypothetical protein